MKKFAFLFLFSSVFVFFLNPSPALADNKCGVNVGPYYGQVSAVRNLVNQEGRIQGGWIVALGTPANCTNFESLFGQGLNVVIRAYNGGQAFTNEQALGWVATLGNLDTKGQKVYFMPWNEPNHDAECGGTSCSPGQISAYVQQLKNYLSGAGLLNTKVILLSPMIDKLNPRFGEFLNGGVYSPSLVSGSSINEYDQAPFGVYNATTACTAISQQNNCLYDTIGIPAPYYALEAGVAGTASPPRYDDTEIRTMLNRSWQKWGGDSNFRMFAIFSYDPHRSGWDLFSASQTTDFYRNTCTSTGNIASDTSNPSVFNQWLENHPGELVACEGCGYASSEAFCTATGASFGETPADQSEASGYVSRPKECDNCNVTSMLTPSCATSFNVLDQITHLKSDGENCGVDQGWWVTKDWGGNVTVDPTNTTIPFVGKTGGENEQLYLADYFEGTQDYYRYYNTPSAAIFHSGVWRKLAPKAVQDAEKRRMIFERPPVCGGEGGVHDYTIDDNSDGDGPVTLEDFAAGPLKGPGRRIPPQENDENYNQEYQYWMESGNPPGQWYRLWASVPMFSREDTPGYIMPYLSGRYPDEFTQVSGTLIDKVPHLARLYDESLAINKVILPSTITEEQAAGKANFLLASAKENVLGEKALLAQAEGCFHMTAQSSATQQAGGGYSVDVTVYFISDGGDGDSYLYGPEFAFQRWNLAAQGTTLTWVPQWTGGPFPVSPGGSFSVSYRGYVDSHSPTCPGVSQYLTCTFSVDEAGNFSTNCGGGGPPEPPACHLDSAPGVASCDKEAIRDSNPNDGLCCDPIVYNLKATDSVLNPYAPCFSPPNPKPLCGGCVDTNGDGDNTDPEDWCCPQHSLAEGCQYNDALVLMCGDGAPDPCNQEVKVSVSRGIGVALAHPYLNEIWKYTAKEDSGFFNIFRPADVDPFKDLDAASSINYSYPGGVSTGVGSFYFPHLGGVQRAKEWVVNALYPNK